MYDFDKVVDRRGTSSIKWNFQNSFGQQSGLLPYWIADTDFATAFTPPSRAGGTAATAGSPRPTGCC